MTAKQKANQERFKKVVAEAKKLRAKNKKLTQAQAVKQAWAIMYTKTGTKKVGAPAKKSVTRTKVKAKKSKKTGEMHTDTKSHNVNIRVVSGMSKEKEKMIEMWSGIYGRLASDLIVAKTLKEKNIIRKEMKIAKEILQKLKKIK